MPDLWSGIDAAQAPAAAPDMWPQPQPKGILERIATETWPARAVQSAYDALMLPGQVAGGVMDVQPSAPNMWSDVDEARKQVTYGTMVDRAGDLGGFLMGGTYGAAPAGSVGSSGARLAVRLPMDEASRMARASEQGFTRDAYHGTTSDFDRFSRIEGGNGRGEGFYFSENPIGASKYATGDVNRISPTGNADPSVMPVKLKMEKPFDETVMLNRKQLKEIENALLASEGRGEWKRGELMNWFDHGYKPTGANVAQTISYNPSEQNAVLRAAGYDGRVGLGMAPGTGRDVMVFNPEQIRSRFAAFDPVNKDSGMLLGSGATDKSGAALAVGLNAAKENPVSQAKTGPLWSAISDVKLRKPLSEMEHRYSDIRDPVEKIFQPEHMVGGNLILTPGDLSAGNRTLTHVDSTKLDRPVTAQGGVSFPEANPGLAWASDRGPTAKLENKAAMLAQETGKPVFISPMTMKSSAIDASHHVADPLSQLVQHAPIKRADATAFNEVMTKYDPNWVSIRSPKFQDYINNLEGGMKIKAAMAEEMNKAAWQKKGFPDVAAIRHAMTEPGLIDVPRNTSGMAISQYIPGQGILDTSHRSYSKGVAGEWKGAWPELVPFDVAAPTIAKGLAEYNAKNLAAGKTVAIQPRYHMEKPTPGVPTHQKLDQEWLDNIMRFFEMKGR